MEVVESEIEFELSSSTVLTGVDDDTLFKIFKLDNNIFPS
jgi:hypothetical protein